MVAHDADIDFWMRLREWDQDVWQQAGQRGWDHTESHFSRQQPARGDRLDVARIAQQAPRSIQDCGCRRRWPNGAARAKYELSSDLGLKGVNALCHSGCSPVE